jgi:protein-L-isoaspartate(D-aspartate) O-methyltransferase
VNSESWNDLIESLIQEGILRSSAVIRAMRLVPRDKFLSESSKAYGAVDSPLPIGLGQTVSAPHSKPKRLLGETWFQL